MQMRNSTEVRKEWSSTIDTVVREKPVIMKRSRDLIYMLSQKDLEQILSSYEFSAEKFIEEDKSVTLSFNEIDIVVNADNEEKALTELAVELKEYAEQYYEEFDYWYSALNRKTHHPYVLRILALDDIDKIKEQIKCQVGKI